MAPRKYSYKDVAMLMASKTILQSMMANRSELSLTRSNWTEAFVTGLVQKIDNAIENYLGLNKTQDLSSATGALTQIITPALRNLGLLKTQIQVDFMGEAENIVKQLGLNKDIHKLSQEQLIELLYAFKKGMTDQLKADIIARGTNPVLIDSIVGYAGQLQEANLSQEGLKSSTKEISQEAVDTFNAIYDEVMGICKIASKIYQDEPLKKEQFTFSKVVKKMGVPKGKDEEVPATT
jgi:hypothetical protein